MATTNTSALEGNGLATLFVFEVSRTGDISQVSTVDWSVVGSGTYAASASDFLNGLFPSGRITFSPGQTSAIIEVYVVGDSTVESDETFSVKLSNASAGTTISIPSATGTILNDDASVSISQATSSNWEGNTGTATPLTFTVTRSGYLNQATTVAWSVVGSGTNPADATDFVGGALPSGTLSFAIGETTKTITVNVSGDTDVEALIENFNVILNTPSLGTVIGTASATGTIRNDDGTPLLSISPSTTSTTEGTGTATTTVISYTITRTVNLSAASSVNWAVSGAGSNPVDAQDFVNNVLPSGIVSFAAGESTKTISLSINRDAVYELDESFNVSLSNPQNASISVGTAGGTIVNDDTNWSISTTDISKTEGNSGPTTFTYTVTRLGVPLAGTVKWSVSGLSGITTSDFYNYGTVFPSGSLVFASTDISKTFTVSVAGDSLFEGNDSFEVSLATATGNIAVYPSAASVTSTIVNDDASLAISATNTSLLEGNLGSTPFTFTVNRGGAVNQVTTVNWAVSGNVSAIDFNGYGGVLPTGSLTFAAGETSKTITLNVNGDDSAVESDETFNVSLSSASVGSNITTTTATGTILNDDASVSISQATSSNWEGNTGTATPLTFTVTRSGYLNQATTVAWSVVGSGTNPADATDFVGGALPSGTLSFAIGETTKTITVNVSGDTDVEALIENFNVILNTPSLGTVIGTASATGTIRNDDGTPLLSISPSTTSTTEGTGTATTTVISYTITRTVNLSAASSVNWAVSGAGSNPVDAQDFVNNVLPSGIVSFAAGESTKTISLSINRDAVYELDESFNVSLSNPQNASISVGTAGGTIVNDDTNWSISTTDISKTEGNSGPTTFTYTVTRLGVPLAGTVKWSVSGLSGITTSDFYNYGTVFPSGSLVFASTDISKTFTVSVAGDSLFEGNDSFEVSLATATGNIAVYPSAASVTSTIVNDDASLAISATNTSLLEGNLGSTPFTFTVNRGGAVNQVTTVNWAVSGNVSAIDFNGYGGVLPTGSLTFAAGETSKTITLNVNGDDSAVESDETFNVSLSSASVGSNITTTTATGTILNDDASVSISQATSSNWEGNTGTATPLTFTVTRSGYLNQATTVAWSVVGSGTNPANAADFSGNALPSGIVSFAANETSKTIIVNVAGDADVEALSENFSVILGTPSVGTVIATASTSGTILNDDGTPLLSISPAATSATEGTGSAATTVMSYVVTRSVNLSSSSGVTWSVVGAGANPVDALDFVGNTLPSGSFVFAANEASKTINVSVARDIVFEFDESYSVVLSNPQNAALGSSAASGTIANDDTSWSISAVDVSKSEGNSGSTSFSYTITRLGPALASTVSWSVAGTDVNAANTSDFSGGIVSGSVSFAATDPASKTFVVNVAGDSSYEADETFMVSLTSATAGSLYPSAKSVVSTIKNDDASVGVISGSPSNDNLVGSAGNDSMNGGAGNDTISGLEGNDLIEGGIGSDVLTGGLGRDSFIFSPGQSGQSAGFDVITDYSKGAVLAGDLIDFSLALSIGGSSAAATATEASINQSSGVASFASGSGTSLLDALSVVASRFTAATDSVGEFALFRVASTGNFYMFISDGAAGVTSNDVVAQLTGVTSIAAIDLAGGNLTITS